jgi:hypothetical protein
VELHTAAGQLGVGEAPRLRDLVEVVEEPWKAIFTGHREAFLSMTAEIGKLAAGNRELLSMGARSTCEALVAVDGGVEIYGPRGAVGANGIRAATRDKVL